MPIEGKEPAKETAKSQRPSSGSRPSKAANRDGASARLRRRALRTGVADRIQHITNSTDRLFGGRLRRRILSRDVKCALARMGIAAVPHPTMFFAFADRAGLEQNRPRPTLDRPKRRPVFLQHQHRHNSSRHVTQIPTIASRSTLLPQGRDSQSWELRFSTCSAARVSVNRFSRRSDAITMLMLQKRLEDTAVPPYRS